MTKRERIKNPRPHRAVDWDEKAIQKVIDRSGYVLVEPKIDGLRCLIWLEDGEVLCTSREGIEIQALANFKPALAEALSHICDGGRVSRVVDTEVYIEGIPFDKASGMLRRNEALPLTTTARFAAFDITSPEEMLGEVADTSTLSARKLELQTRLDPRGLEVHAVAARACTTTAQVGAAYTAWRAAGYEGLVVKDPHLPYRNGKVSGWWKCKSEISEDGVVVGYVPGVEGKANAGKIVGYEVALESGAVVKATGLTRVAIEEATKAYLTEGYGGVSHIGRYCEVAGMERTASGKIRHPKFKRWRDLEGAEGVKA